MGRHRDAHQPQPECRLTWANTTKRLPERLGQQVVRMARFLARWIPVRATKTRQAKELQDKELRF